MKRIVGAQLMSVEQASDEFGIPLDTVDRLIKQGKLPYVKLPDIRRRFIVRKDMEDAIRLWRTWRG